jgi:hypothetical protein
MTSSFALPPSVSFVMSLKNATGQNSRGCWRAESVTQAVSIRASVAADLLLTAIIAASKLIAPATRTLARIARPPSRTNPKNQVRNNNNNNSAQKHAHNVHYHDGHHHGSDDKSLVSCTSATPSNDKLSANKSGGNCTLENYHLDSFHISKKRKVGDVGHKSPVNNPLVEPVSQDLDASFNDDGSFLKAHQEDSGLSMRNDNDVFNF